MLLIWYERVGNSQHNSRERNVSTAFFFPESYLVWEDESRATILQEPPQSDRETFAAPFLLFRRNRVGPRRCVPYKHIRPLTKSVPASLQKVLTMISWPKSSGSAGDSWSSVFSEVFFLGGVNHLWLTDQFPIWIFIIKPLPRFTLIKRLNGK